MQDRIEALGQKILGYNPQADLKDLARAYDFARQHHEGQKRASGDPYISHPLEVVEILADLKVDMASIIAGMLHDTVEDTSATSEDIRKLFGEEVQKLVQGVTKLARIEFQSTVSKQAENFRKFVLAVADDIRVLLIKMADRLHNMRTIHHLLLETSRRRIALETLEIYAPLAQRIGLNIIQEELQELSFAQLNPQAYGSIKTRIEQLCKSDPNTNSLVISDLENILERGGVKATISGRQKKIYAIWRKMQQKNVSFEQLSDIVAFRVLVGSVADCYQSLGLIHSEYFVIPGKFKDYISTPKPNNYQSLHTHVIAPNQRQIEIQIRTFGMQEIAEYGIAAHWQYKQKVPLKEGTQYRWVRGLLDVLEQTSGSAEFLENTKLEMFQDQVFCFTPHGDLVDLPKGATVVDFAYALNADIGNRCKEAKINGKLMPLRSELKNGDQVEIITSVQQVPSPTWERFVVTGKAKASIRRFVKSKRRSQFINLGKSILLKELENRNIAFEDEVLSTAAQHFHLETVEDLCMCLGENLIAISDVVSFISPEASESKPQVEEGEKVKKTTRNRVAIRGLIPGMAIHYAGCCHPLPGEKITGIITAGKGVTIHLSTCELVKEFDESPDRLLEVSWGDTKDEIYVGRLFVTLQNKAGSLGTLATIIGNHGGNIFNLKLTRRHVDFFDFLIDVNVKDIQQLDTIIASLRAHEMIHLVDRP
ncbi:MAG: bifunctional (p)ppGpp synthetase/guanosine-3',5'-bis(diphosphate) 3'-pyrophosphohydrolase [Alphaproteobacteria bacterium]